MKKYLNLKWFFFRIIREFRFPSTKVGKGIVKFFFKPKNKGQFHNFNENSLICFYDLNYSPATFNFSEFLVLCNHETLKKKLQSFKIVFIKRKTDLVNYYTEDKDYRSVHNIESEEWKLNNILIPLTSFTKLCSGYDFVYENNELKYYLNFKNRYPEKYDLILKETVNVLDLYNKIDKLETIGLELPKQAEKYINNYLDNLKTEKKIITITIRDQKYDAIRNSNISDWVKFADFLQENNYEVIIIPDTDNAYNCNKIFHKFNVFNAACFNLSLRFGIYCKAYFNYFAGGGPVPYALCINLTNI